MSGLRSRRTYLSPQPEMTPRRDESLAPPTLSLLSEMEVLPPPSVAPVVSEALDDRLASWIVVYGLDAEACRDPVPVLVKYRAFGDIREHEVGRGNWLFVRYASRLQAEKALAQPAMLLDGGATLVAALRPTPDVAFKFGLHLNPDGSSLAASRSQLPPPQHFNVLRPPPQYDHDDLRDDPYNYIRRRKRGLCARLMAYLFSW